MKSKIIPGWVFIIVPILIYSLISLYPLLKEGVLMWINEFNNQNTCNKILLLLLTYMIICFVDFLCFIVISNYKIIYKEEEYLASMLPFIILIDIFKKVFYLINKHLSVKL